MGLSVRQSPASTGALGTLKACWRWPVEAAGLVEAYGSVNNWWELGM